MCAGVIIATYGFVIHNNWTEDIMGLLRIFRDWASQFYADPKAFCDVEGFSVEIEKKDGVLLTSKPKDDETAVARDASIGSYYEVSVKSDGTNPEYPASEKPWVQRFTVGAGGNKGFGFVGGASYIPEGARWTRFILAEEYDDAKTPPMGKWMPAHHTVLLRGFYKDDDGRENSMAIGGWVRKSETESPEWKAAARSPVTYI